jgi:UDP-N-acetylenolpyruvoylglucosamine reductase
LNQPCLVLFVGAGDIDQWARDFVGRLDNSALRPGPSMAGIDVSWWHAFAEQIQSRSTVRFDEPLAEKTTLRVGGPAFLYAEPATADDLSDLLRAAQERQLPVFFLGRGSNLIVPDEGFRGLVVRLSGSSWNEVSVLPDHRIYAGGGARLKQICGEACKQGLSGFEFLEGIPGSMGGALRMNAGAMGAWIFDVVEEVRIMTLDGVLHTLTREAFHVGYRDCRELRDAIAVGATLRASGSADPEVIRKKIGGFSRKRRESQPREPSSGCIFKNPEGHFAGQLIDELGLKGKRLGAAQVSEVHGNFIVNRGGATSGDVIGLINAIRREVRNRRGIVLQPEVLLMGQLWGDDL